MVLLPFGCRWVHGARDGLPQVRIMLIDPVGTMAAEGTNKLL
jgi:hypothetical protein